MRKGGFQQVGKRRKEKINKNCQSSQRVYYYSFYIVGSSNIVTQVCRNNTKSDDKK